MFTDITDALLNLAKYYCVCYIGVVVINLVLRIVRRSMYPHERECIAVRDNGYDYFYYEKNGEPVVIETKHRWFCHCGQTVKARVSVVREGSVPRPVIYIFVNAIYGAATFLVLLSFALLFIFNSENTMLPFYRTILSFTYFGVSLVLEILVKLIIFSGIAVSFPICEEVRQINGSNAFMSQRATEQQEAREIDNNEKKYIIYYPIEYKGSDMLLYGETVNKEVKWKFPVVIRYSKKNPGAFITLNSLVGTVKVGIGMLVVPILISLMLSFVINSAV